MRLSLLSMFLSRAGAPGKGGDGTCDSDEDHVSHFTEARFTTTTERAQYHRSTWRWPFVYASKLIQLGIQKFPMTCVRHDADGKYFSRHGVLQAPSGMTYKYRGYPLPDLGVENGEEVEGCHGGILKQEEGCTVAR
ncbi:hypothetical protein BDR04DRAFT_1104404 [Suillus decipiens]|nr:hypothetical protein BDR04DRAFT_1104404 [Suillus decipiens]